MEVVDRIRWIPDFGYERELDWLRNMHDWMISKKRYWGLALPIYDCSACGRVEVIGGREELKERAVEGWDAFEGHTPHRPYVDAVKIACPGCGAPVERIKDVGNPWLDAGIVPFSTLHYREDPEYWRQWFPADFITESFPGQFRNWFYSMLAMSTVLRREPPFKTIFGYATLFAEDGRPMHKSSGNMIEFDDAADRMGVDVMRWMFAKSRPEENILFGWHAADEARRELLILWNVYSFFVTYARLAGWSPTEAAPPVGERRALDRWILSRAAGTADTVEARLRETDAAGAAKALSSYLDGLSTWYLRLSRRRFSRSRRSARSGRRVRHAPRGPRGGGPDARTDAAVPRRVALREPRHDGRARGTRQRPPHPLADRGARGPPRRRAGALDGGRPGRGGPGPHPAQRRRTQDPPAPRDGLDRRCRIAAWRSTRSSSGSSPRRSTSRRSSSSMTTRRWSSGGSSRSCPRSGRGSGLRSPP